MMIPLGGQVTADDSRERLSHVSWWYGPEDLTRLGSSFMAPQFIDLGYFFRSLITE
jgi:hypothetical protein